MAVRSTFAACLMLVVPGIGGAQQRLGMPVSTYDPPRGWGGSIAGPGLFGPRIIGQSLAPRGRSFARGTAPPVVGPGLAPIDFGGLGTIQGDERFTRMGRQPGDFVGADPADLPAYYTDLPVDAAGNAWDPLGRGLRQPPRSQPYAQPPVGPGMVGPGVARPGMTAPGMAVPVTAGPVPQVRRSVSRSAAIAYSAPAGMQTQLAARLQSMVGRKDLPPITATLQERTVVLRGSVATAHDRDLAGRLALLEAGIDQVQNELTVGPPQTPAPPAPALSSN
jgi:hypothetical protein